MSKDILGQKLFTVLPSSMESKDLLATYGDLKALKAYSDSIAIEHDKKTCKVPSGKGSSQIEHMKRKLESYQSLYTEKDLNARYTCIEHDGSIEIQTYAEVIDASNCVTGSWRATWTAKILSEKSANLFGTINIHVHYYENGANVQTRSVRTFESEVISAREEKVNAMVHKWEKEKMSYEEQLAKVIINAIAARETVLYDDLQKMFNEIDSNIKKLRRILPITKTRFKWDTAAQKQVKLLNERKSG